MPTSTAGFGIFMGFFKRFLIFFGGFFVVDFIYFYRVFLKEFKRFFSRCCSKKKHKEDSYKRSFFITFGGNETMVWFVDLGVCAVQKKKNDILCKN